MLNLIIPMEGYITIGDFYENPVFTSGTTIIFDSDEAFEDFCVAPLARIRNVSDEELVSCGGAYTEMYTKCIKAGMKFLIRDRQSKVYKRKAVTKRVLTPSELGGSRKDVPVQLRVQNLVSPGVLPGCFLYYGKVYCSRDAISLVIRDLMDQGKKPEQVCEVLKPCFDSFITENAYAELGDTEKENYKKVVRVNRVSYHFTEFGFHNSELPVVAAEYGIKIERVAIDH